MSAKTKVPAGKIACLRCDGSGKDPDRRGEPCRLCDGSGVDPYGTTVPPRLPDSPSGALRAIESELGIGLSEADGDVRATPDPHVEGVWKIEVPDGRAFVVELAGYPDVFGRTRERTTVEEGLSDSEARALARDANREMLPELPDFLADEDWGSR